MATAALGLAVLFARLTMAALRYEARWTNAAYDALLAALWAFSAAAQDGPDLSDPEHLSARPWYLARGCDAAWRQNRGWCRLAQWEYAWAMLAAYVERIRSFYAARFAGALGWSLYEKGIKDGSATGRRKKSWMDGRAWDGEGGWVASYKDDAEGSTGHDLSDLTSYRSLTA